MIKLHHKAAPLQNLYLGPWRAVSPWTAGFLTRISIFFPMYWTMFFYFVSLGKMFNSCICSIHTTVQLSWIWVRGCVGCLISSKITGSVSTSSIRQSILKQDINSELLLVLGVSVKISLNVCLNGRTIKKLQEFLNLPLFFRYFIAQHNEIWPSIIFLLLFFQAIRLSCELYFFTQKASSIFAHVWACGFIYLWC